jgi:hypothetical protein
LRTPTGDLPSGLWVPPTNGVRKMDCLLFRLTTAEDEHQIFAWGMEITDNEKTEAVVYRRDPATKSPIFGVHSSAEAALTRYQRIIPMALHWEDDEDD